MSIVDALSTVKDLLNNNWNSSNTDGVKPNIQKVFDVKRIGGLTAKTDNIMIYEGRTIQRANAIGTSTRYVRTPVSIDIRTTVSRDRSIKILKEVDRIVNNNIINPDSNYNILDPDSGWIDLSNKTIKLFRFVYDVYLEKLNEAR